MRSGRGHRVVPKCSIDFFYRKVASGNFVYFSKDEVNNSRQSSVSFEGFLLFAWNCDLPFQSAHSNNDADYHVIVIVQWFRIRICTGNYAFNFNVMLLVKIKTEHTVYLCIKIDQMFGKSKQTMWYQCSHVHCETWRYKKQKYELQISWIGYFRPWLICTKQVYQNWIWHIIATKVYW